MGGGKVIKDDRNANQKINDKIIFVVFWLIDR